ncbi:MAG: acyltransferase [Nitrospirae bacterium]|nr:acyltransferase [Nitrospirota bacterium]
MKAGFYQFNPEFGEKDRNLQKVLETLTRATFDLIVLPEFFATGYQFTTKDEVAELSETIMDGKTVKALSDLSNEKSCYIVAGLPERDKDLFYNSAVLTGPQGYIGTYRKTHLFFEEKLFFQPGDTGFKVWDTNIGCIGIMICFDWFFPEAMRTLALKGAEIIAHPANLVLPYCPQSMPVRCLENRVFAITSNRIGIENRKSGELLKYIGQSQITGHDGQILVRASEDEEAFSIIEIEIEKARDKQLNKYNNLFTDRRPDMYNLS